MIQQPTNITPSSFGSLGNGVVDLTLSTLDITWQINGDSALYAYQIDFYEADDIDGTAVASTGKVTLSSPVWGRSYTGEYVPFTATISNPSSTLSGMTNGFSAGYAMVIRQWYGSGADDYVDQTQPSYFVTRTTPTIAITTPADPYAANEITLSATYTQAEGDTLNWFRWVLTDDNGYTIHDSGKVYGTGNIQCYYDGLFANTTYHAAIEVETANGQTATDETDINVQYTTVASQGSIEVSEGDCFVRVSWDTLRQIYGEPTGSYSITDGTLTLPSGSNILWDEMNDEPFSFAAPLCWAWSGTAQTLESTKVFSIYGESDTLDYYLGGNQVIVQKNGTAIKTVSVPVGVGERFAIAQSRTNLYIYRLHGTGGLEPSETLTPSNLLVPQDATGTEVLDYSTTIADQQFAITGVQVYGACLHHYIWAASGNISADTLAEISALDSDPTPTASDVFYCNYDNALNAGSLSDYSGRIEGWSIYRQTNNESTLKHIIDLPVSESFVNDFSAVSQTEYTYYVFPYGEDIFITQPLISDSFVPVWWCYALITAEEQEDGYTYVKQDAYKFGLNVSTSAMSNNNTPSILQNFTGVPYMQISPDNYLTGSLSALIGRVKDDTYTDSVPLRDAIMALSTYTGAMFLKDRKGSIFKVRPNAPISMQTADRQMQQSYTMSLSWVQIEAGDNFSIIGTSPEESGTITDPENIICNYDDASGLEF